MRRGFHLPRWAKRSERRISRSRQSALGLSPYHRRLHCEALEDRRLLSTFTVTNTNDGPVTHSGALPGSLRQAIYDANTHPGDDTITFDSSLASSTITLTSGDLDLTDTAGKTTIGGLVQDQLSITDNNTSDACVVHISSGATVNISGLTISSGKGDGVQNSGVLTINACTISKNSKNGVDNIGAMTIVGGTISGNSWDGVANGGTMTIDSCTISGNSGAGVYNGATMTVSNCTISTNGGYGLPLYCVSGGDGAGMDNEGTLTITNSTICENWGNGSGGGVWNGGTLTANDCTISKNACGFTSVTTPSHMLHGGGICTFTSMVAGTTILHNTIVANNYTVDSSVWYDDDLCGPLTANYCLLGPDTYYATFSSSAGNNIQAGPYGGGLGLGPLADNGGPTQTMALLPGSPAIDAGSNALIPAGVTTDQCGNARISNGTVDIGAVESQTDVGDTLDSAKNLGTLSADVLTTQQEEIGNGPNGAKDVDMYQFTVSQDTEVYIRVTPFDGHWSPTAAASKTCVQLFHGSGGLIASSVTVGDDIWPESYIEYKLSPGIYCVGVSGGGNNSYDPKVADSGQDGKTGPYTIRLTCGNGLGVLQDRLEELSDLGSVRTGLNAKQFAQAFADAVVTMQGDSFFKTCDAIVNDGTAIVGLLTFNYKDAQELTKAYPVLSLATAKLLLVLDQANSYGEALESTDSAADPTLDAARFQGDLRTWVSKNEPFLSTADEDEIATKLESDLFKDSDAGGFSAFKDTDIAGGFSGYCKYLDSTVQNYVKYIGNSLPSNYPTTTVIDYLDEISSTLRKSFNQQQFPAENCFGPWPARREQLGRCHGGLAGRT